MKYSKRPPRTNFKRRRPKRSKLGIAKLSRAVKKLQSQNDGEKKRITTFYSSVVGQVNNDADGAVVLDVTPGCIQGVATNQRTGASIRLHSTNYQFQLSQQGNLEASVRYKITWFAIYGAPYTTADLSAKFFSNTYNPNPFIGGSIRDYNAQYNPDHFGTCKILRTVRGSVSADQLSGLVTNKTFNVGFKYNRGKGHDVRYNQNLGTTSNVFNGQIVMIVQLDRGNSGSSPSNVTGLIPSSFTPATGLAIQYNKTDYYYDN